MTDKGDWQGSSGENWAAEWRRTDRSFSNLTERLLRKTRDFRFKQVLDIGCGAGELSLAIGRGRQHVSVSGVDVSPHLVAVAKQRGAHLSNVSFTLGDAAQWAAEEGVGPDMLVSRHGVMFFDDPPAAFANLAAQSQPGANFLFSCFRGMSQNPFFTEVLRLLPGAPPVHDPLAPGPFAFADRERVSAILRAGGWDEISLEQFDYPMIAGAGENPVEEAFAYFSRIGPAARASTELDAGARAHFYERLRILCERSCYDGIVALPAAAWIVTARKAS